jgi:hypothetical protein
MAKMGGCFWNHRRDYFDAPGVGAGFDERRNAGANIRPAGERWNRKPADRPGHIAGPAQPVFNFLHPPSCAPAVSIRDFIVWQRRLESTFA